MPSNRKLFLPLLLLLLCCFGAIGVQALPTCQRLVKTYKTYRTRNKVSPIVAARWAIWNKEHPDYKPTGNRPKYKYTRKEVIDKVNFACPLPPAIINQEVALDPLPPMTEELSELPPDLPPALYHTPDVINVAQNNTPSLPFVPPYSSVVPPTNTQPVPEPSSLLLLLTGAAGVYLLARRRAALAISPR